jgi:hypothetical protein
MLDSLDYTLSASNTSVVDRRQHIRAFPTSASTLNPASNRNVRIRVGGDDFIDSSSVRLMYTIRETAGAILTPLGGPWCMWASVRLMSNGVILDDIPAYGRFHEQFSWNHLSQAQQFGEAGVCGFGGSETTGSKNRPAMGTIAANASYTVMHPLSLSLFSSGKLLPVRYAPLELDMVLGEAADWLNSGSGMSQSYEVTNICLIYDSYVLDEAVLESYYRAILNNRVLSINTMTAVQVFHTVPANSSSFSFTTVRAFSRLSHCWITFRKTGAKSTSFICPTTIADNAGATPSLSNQGPSVRLQIGPKSWPEAQPNDSIPQLFYQMQKAIPGIPNINRDDFLQRCFTVVFDLRKVPSDPTSSLSTRSGDLLRCDLTNLTLNDAQYECWMTLFAFSVTAIRESGVTLLT